MFIVNSFLLFLYCCFWRVHFFFTWFNKMNKFKHIYLPHKWAPNRLRLYVRVELGVMAMKRYFAPFISIEQELYHQMLFNLILRTSLFCGRVLPFCWGIQSVYFKLCWPTGQWHSEVSHGYYCTSYSYANPLLFYHSIFFIDETLVFFRKNVPQIIIFSLIACSRFGHYSFEYVIGELVYVLIYLAF